MHAEPVAAAGLDAARAVADAILYEGYLLYPYRRSSVKNTNKVRWQFGVLLPQEWARAHGLSDAGVAGSAESWWQQTECLIEGPLDARVEVRIRFLQVQSRSLEERLPGGEHRTADVIELGSRLEMGFDEAVPREFEVRATVAELLGGARRAVVRAPGGEESEPLTDERGRRAGQVLRRRWPVTAAVTLSMTGCGTAHPLHRLRVRVENIGEATLPEAAREEALRNSLIAAHALIAVGGGSFVSLLDPPEWAQEAAHACVNVHTFPVLAGEEGRRDLVLSSPILLYDHPRVAPESPGDLHDATEIDEILSLRTLTLTEEEKREARATDPRAAAILDRVDTMPPEVMSRLHGAVRSMRPAAASETAAPEAAASGIAVSATAVSAIAASEAAVSATAASAIAVSATAASETAASETAVSGAAASEAAVSGEAVPEVVGAGSPVAGVEAVEGEVPWWDPGADASVSPGTDSVMVDGVPVARGSRVRLRPRLRGTDPQDRFLEGRIALVEAVLLDVDGAHHLAVTLEDDPAAELNQWYGRYRYFAPDEVRPL